MPERTPPAAHAAPIITADEPSMPPEKRKALTLSSLMAAPQQVETPNKYVGQFDTHDNKGRPLHPDLPTLVRLQSGDYIELRCYVCGGNHSRGARSAEASFLSGLPGFQRHLSSAHNIGRTFDQVLRDCAHKRLTGKQVRGMLKKKEEGAYSIERVDVAAAEVGTAVKKQRKREIYAKPGKSSKKTGRTRDEVALSKAIEDAVIVKRTGDVGRYHAEEEDSSDDEPLILKKRKIAESHGDRDSRCEGDRLVGGGE